MMSTSMLDGLHLFLTIKKGKIQNSAERKLILYLMGDNAVEFFTFNDSQQIYC